MLSSAHCGRAPLQPQWEALPGTPSPCICGREEGMRVPSGGEGVSVGAEGIKWW